MNIYILISLFIILVIGLVVYFKFKRNYFNKYKYIRIVKYNNDKTVTVSYKKQENFNIDNSLLVNPEHIFNFKGYTSIITTSNAQESINPLNFDSKFNATDYKSAIRSKVISETFESLKPDKLDKIMALLFLNILQLIAIVYLIYNLMEV